MKSKVNQSDIKRLLSPELEKENVLFEIKKLPPKTIVKADERLLEQVFINLIGNSWHALKKIKKPKIVIDCTINEKNTNIRISDNGKGIPPEIMNQIFIPFYTTRKEGSGIGLSSSKDIMKKHGGDIFVQSIENEYTTFSLLLKN